MILSKRVSLGGVQLDELHERVVVLGIDPGTPNESVQTISRMGGSGQRVTLQHWEKLDITVTYGIDVPKTNMILRRQIFDMVNAWALKKGWLRVNWMPGKRVYIDKVTVPTSGDLWEWTNNYTISFTAYNVPFWQDENPTADGTRCRFPEPQRHDHQQFHDQRRAGFSLSDGDQSWRIRHAVDQSRHGRYSPDHRRRGQRTAETDGPG